MAANCIKKMYFIGCLLFFEQTEWFSGHQYYIPKPFLPPPFLLELRHKKSAEENLCTSVGLPGLEPGKTGPESVVLPLHHSPIFHQNHPFCFDDAKILLF